MIQNYRKYLLYTVYLLALFTLAFYTERHNFELLIGVILVSFSSYYFLIKEELSIKEVLFFGLLLRALFIPSIPVLSDDYFRFIWDGKMILNGISPFQYLPSEYIKTTQDSYLIFLYENMNSPNYFSVYPPISQLIYSFSAVVNHNLVSVIIIRLFLILADIIVFFYLRKLLSHFNKNENLAVLYFFNPLIIIELSGNLHFEGLMLTFLLMAVFYLLKHKYLLSALMFSISVGLKLIPLMFIPLLFFNLPKERRFKYVLLVGVFVVMQFVPLVDIELLQKMFESVNLYFQSFEFNASIYYLLRWIGYQIYGYNVIQILGVSLAIFSLLSIILISFIKREEKIFFTFLILNIIYLLLSTTIHPWYLVLPLAFSVFTNYRFVIAWSFMIFLSYSAYRTEIYNENLRLVGVEYFVVFSILIAETILNKKKNILTILTNKMHRLFC